MFIRICIVFYCWANILYTVVGDNNEPDYYGNRALRSGNKIMDCGSGLFEDICRLKCGEDHACLFGQCYCLEPDSKNIKDEFLFKNREAIEQYKDLQPKQMDYGIRPALRHHIAHFCQNLDEARVCIRKCMKLGKPAFCGKDRVCYCGHNYGNPSNNKEDPEQTHNQFQDLYEKYFGKKN